MWIISSGRQTKAIEQVIKTYDENQEVMKVDMIENLVAAIEIKGKESLKDITSIGILDAGIYSLKDWRPLFSLTKKLSHIPFLIYSRYPEMTPEASVFGDNVTLIVSENEISIIDFVQRMMKQSKKEKEVKAVDVMKEV